MARNHDAHRFHLVHGRVGRVEEAGVRVEANVTFDGALEVLLEVVHDRRLYPVRARTARPRRGVARNGSWLHSAQRTAAEKTAVYPSGDGVSSSSSGLPCER